MLHRCSATLQETIVRVFASLLLSTLAHVCRCVTGVHTAVLRSGVVMLPPIARQLSAWDDRATRGTVATGTKSTMEGHIIIDVDSLIEYKSAPTTCGLSDCTSMQPSNRLIFVMQSVETRVPGHGHMTLKKETETTDR